MLFAMLTNVFSCMCLAFNPESLLPTFVAGKYPVINEAYVGILLAIFPFGFLLAAPLIGKYME